MIKKTSNKIRFILVIIILIFTISFRVSWVPGGDMLLEKEFKTFPLKMDGWQGKESFLDEEVLKVLGLTDYMMRDYSRSNSKIANEPRIPINLYVGYYASQSKGKTYHSPKNCLPGSGWELTNVDKTLIDFNGESHEINKVIIQKGLEKQLVLYWFQDRGRIIASEYSAKIFLVLDSIFKRRTDGAFIRIIAPIGDSIEKTLDQEIDFAKTIFPYLKEYLPKG